MIARSRYQSHGDARVVLCTTILVAVCSYALHGQETKSEIWAGAGFGVGLMLSEHTDHGALGGTVRVRGGIRIDSTVRLGIEGVFWIDPDNFSSRRTNSSLVALVSPFRGPVSLKAGAGIALEYSRVGFGLTAGIDYEMRSSKTFSLTAGADWLLQKYSSSNETRPSTNHFVLITVGLGW
jgi:hypothetical protein